MSERISGFLVWGPSRCGLKGWSATGDHPKNQGGLENCASMETGSHGLAKEAWTDNRALPHFARVEYLCLDIRGLSFAWAVAPCKERCHSLGPLRLVCGSSDCLDAGGRLGFVEPISGILVWGRTKKNNHRVKRGFAPYVVWWRWQYQAQLANPGPHIDIQRCTAAPRRFVYYSWVRKDTIVKKECCE